MGAYNRNDRQHLRAVCFRDKQWKQGVVEKSMSEKDGTRFLQFLDLLDILFLESSELQALPA